LDWKPTINHSEGMRRTLAWLQTIDLGNLKQK
jgi:hypothetical protein